MDDYRAPRPADDSAIDIVEVLQPLDQALADARGPEDVAAIESRMTSGQRLLRAYNLFVAEVEFNGLAGYFAGAEGWRDVLSATQLFKMPEDERLVRDAVSLFPGDAPAEDWDERQMQVEAIDESKWDELAARWAEIQARGTDAGIRRYILDNPEEFFRP